MPLRLLLLAAPLLAAAALAAPAGATTYCVHAQPTACPPAEVNKSSNLQGALNAAGAANDHDVVNVGLGIYVGPFTYTSNFPVDMGSCDYATLWNAFKVIAKGASAAEKTALFSGTAARVYRLEL